MVRKNKKEDLTMDDMFIKIRGIKSKLEEIYECGRNNKEVNINLYVAMIFFIFLHSCEKNNKEVKKR
jgi:hypothetical protein